MYIAEHEVKGSGYLLFVVLEKPLYEVCLVRIKEQVHKKGSTVATHRNTDLKKRPPNITNMLSIKKLNYYDDISFRILFTN